MSDSFTFKGTLAFEEYHECHRHNVMVRRFVIRTVAVAFGVFVAGNQFLANAAGHMGSLFLGLFLILYGLVLSPAQFKWRVKRNWDKYPSAKREFEMTLGPEGVDSMDDKNNPAHTSWDRFIKFKETPALFLIFLSPRLPLLLPKRLLQAGTEEEVRDLLKKSIA